MHIVSACEKAQSHELKRKSRILKNSIGEAEEVEKHTVQVGFDVMLRSRKLCRRPGNGVCPTQNEKFEEPSCRKSRGIAMLGSIVQGFEEKLGWYCGANVLRVAQ
jgi:hypothetical protein